MPSAAFLANLLLCLAWAPAVLAQTAAAPTPMTDAIVAYDRPPPTFGRPSREVHHQHAGRTRIVSRVERSDGVVANQQAFTGPGQLATFTVGRFANGQPAFLSIMDDPLSAPPPAKARTYTGATETRLGESCRVWRVATTIARGTEFVQSGCLTADGIELWRRQGEIDAIFATKVTRQVIAPAEVRLPVELLNLSRWSSSNSPADHTKDFEVVLAPASGEGRRVTVRRSGAWKAVEERYRNWVSFLVTNPQEALRLWYSRSPNGDRHLDIGKQPFFSASNVEYSGERAAARDDETILGERCSWWNMMPNVADAGRYECRTEDGVPLKIEFEARADVQIVVASSLQRTRQPISGVMPGKEIASPAAWGF